MPENDSTDPADLAAHPDLAELAERLRPELAAASASGPAPTTVSTAVPNPVSNPAPPAAAPRRGSAATPHMWPWVVAVMVLLPLALLASGPDEANAPGNTAAAGASSLDVPAVGAATAGSDAASAVDTIFVNNVRAHLVPFDTDAHVVRLGHLTCDSFAEGDQLLDVSRAAVSYSVTSGTAAVAWSPDQAGFVVGAAVVAYCPQYVDRLKG